MRRFEGKTAILTGGSSGIGAAVSERLLTEGAKVIIWDQLQPTNTNAQPMLDYINVDVSDWDSTNKALESTKKYFNESKSITGVELKEFSLLYLVLNNLSLYQKNIHLIENIKLFTEVNKQILDATILKLKSGEQIAIEDLNLDKQLLEKINKFAPIKHILKNKPNNDNQVIELLDDISKDLFNYDLELRIQELESKFSKDMSETTFNELKELKNERKIN